MAPRLTCGQGLLREPEHAQRLAPLTASFIPCSVPLALSGSWPWRGAAVEGGVPAALPSQPFPPAHSLTQAGATLLGLWNALARPPCLPRTWLACDRSPCPQVGLPCPSLSGEGLTSVQKAAVPLLVFPGGSRLWTETAVSDPRSPTTSWVALGVFLTLSEPQSPPLRNGIRVFLA